MDGYQEEGNSGKYHWLTYKWLLELSPKPVNHRNSTVVFKGIWKFSKNRMQERNTFISIALKTSYCHYWVSPFHSVVSVGTKWTRKATFQWPPDYQRPLCEVFPRHFLNPWLMSPMNSFSLCWTWTSYKPFFLTVCVIHKSVASRMLCLAFLSRPARSFSTSLNNLFYSLPS